MKHRWIEVAFLLTSALGLAHGAERPSFGAADFLPTPDQPVGFRADGNGWYPAATPPLEWWEGKPGMVDATPPQAGQPAPAKVLGYTDRQSKNVFWKTHLPGWGEAQPLVIGDRIIVLNEPDLVVCYDANTGKELWQDRVELMTLPLLGADRRTLEPAPADAAKRQVVWEVARASAYLHRNVRGATGAEAAALGGKAVTAWTDWKKLLAANDPRFVPVADQAIAAAMAFVAGNKDAVAGIRGDWAALTREYRVPVPSIPDGSSLLAGMANNIGPVTSTPTSDGRVVVSVFGYGQVVAHDVATGKRQWAWRDGAGPSPAGDQIPSPRLWGGLVFVRSLAGTELLGIRLADGTVKWEADLNGPQQPGEGNKPFGNYVTPVVTTLADGKGGRLPVIISNMGLAVRPTDGAILGQVFPRFSDKAAGLNVLPGDRLLVVENGCGTTPKPALHFYQLAMSGLNTVTSTPIMTEPRPNYFHGESLAVSDRLICGDANILTLAAQQVWGTGHTVGYFDAPTASVVAGNRLIGGQSSGPFDVMKVWDLSGANPVLLSDRSLIGDGSQPSDLIWDRYLKPHGFDLGRNLGRDQGIHSHGLRLGGAVPQGDRLFLRTLTHLYCIGPSLKGAPQDDPKVVAGIRTGKDAAQLATRLTDASAQYRIESLRRLQALGALGAFTNQLAVLAADPYEEIRAEAIEALDAADPAGRPGTALLMAQLAKSVTTELLITLRTLGPAGTARIDAQFATAQKDAYFNLLDLCRQLGHVSPAMLERVLVKDALGVYKGKLPPWQIAVHLGAIADRDPRIVPLLKEWITIQDDSCMLTPLFQALIPRLPAEQRLTTCLDLAVANSGKRIHGGDNKGLDALFPQLYEPGCVPKLEAAVAKAPSGSGWFYRLAGWLAQAKAQAAAANK